MAIRKREAVKESGVAGQPAGDSAFLKKYPQLWEHLTLSKYEDGSSRETSTLSVFCQDGSIKGILRDKDMGEVLFVTADGVMALFEVLEAKLGDPEADWRKDGFAKDRGKDGPKKGARRGR